MRYNARKGSDVTAESDMTPMIDMTFQLIAFFMVLMNFGEAQQDARVNLPSSELAKPPDAPLVSPVILQVTNRGLVLFLGQELTVEAMEPLIEREKLVIERIPNRRAADATVVIRADGVAKTGRVQDLVRICQDLGFEKFIFRAKQEQPGS
jgi:biopolymer transport protein ExbD